MILGLTKQFDVWIDETYDSDVLFEYRDMTLGKGGKQILALKYIPNFIKPTVEETIDYLDQLLTFS